MATLHTSFVALCAFLLLEQRQRATDLSNSLLVGRRLAELSCSSAAKVFAVGLRPFARATTAGRLIGDALWLIVNPDDLSTTSRNHGRRWRDGDTCVKLGLYGVVWHGCM